MIAPVNADLFFQEKLLINDVDLKIKFIWAKDEFCLMAVENLNQRVKILPACIYGKNVSVAPGNKLAHAKALTQGNVKYPIDCVCPKHVSILIGTRVCNQDNLFLGQIPKFIFMCFAVLLFRF